MRWHAEVSIALEKEGVKQELGSGGSYGFKHE